MREEKSESTGGGKGIRGEKRSEKSRKTLIREGRAQKKFGMATKIEESSRKRVRAWGGKENRTSLKRPGDPRRYMEKKLEKQDRVGDVLKSSNGKQSEFKPKWGREKKKGIQEKGKRRLGRLRRPEL